jgi:secondary thiamine-phosphate synthase enzyme|tara:strand:+ start:120 stop:551 length:432 start_codon:yes stop_codon:yes gene_type:complete
MNKYLKYGQGEIKINTSGQKMYEITDDVNAWIKKEEISGGQLTIFIKHTSASLCIQENASRDVLEDIDNFLKKLVPENPTLYRHNIEGKDDMPAHIKSMLTQTSLTVPVRDKKMNLGTWQGIFLLEHRINSLERKINFTLIGE